eukprot:g6699.t1
MHPTISRLRKLGLNTPALSELNDRWAGYVFGRASMAMEVGNFSYRNVFATHCSNGVLTEDSFKSVIRQFEPDIKSDQLTRLWFFADEDGSGRIDLFEFMRMIGCNSNGEIGDEYYEDVEFTKRETTQVFHRINTSGSGFMSVHELETALEAAGAKCTVSEAWVKETFQAVHGVCFAEVARLNSEKDRLPSDAVFSVIEQLVQQLVRLAGDTSPDLCFDALNPFITADHFNHLLSSRLGLHFDPVKAKQIFKLIDSDRDGKITRLERGT